MIKFLTNNVKKPSVAGKLRHLVMITCGSAVLITATALFLLGAAAYRQSMLEHLSSVAGVIAVNATAPLAFDDARSAEKLLHSLNIDARVAVAALYTKGGEPFANYSRDPDAVSAGASEDRVWRAAAIASASAQYRFELDDLDLIAPIILNGEIVGYVQLESDLTPVYRELFKLLLIVAAIVTAVIAVAYRLSRGLQRRNSAPVSRLAEALVTVGQTQDYTLRLEPSESDEIGALIAGFIGQVQTRDARLVPIYRQGARGRAAFVTYHPGPAAGAKL